MSDGKARSIGSPLQSYAQLSSITACSRCKSLVLAEDFQLHADWCDMLTFVAETLGNTFISDSDEERAVLLKRLNWKAD